MKNFKQMYGRSVTLAFLLAACTAAALPALAQDSSAPPPPPPGHGRGGPGGPEMQERQLEMMTKRLNLTPDQVTQIKAIQADDRKQAMAAREDNSTSGGDRHAKMMAMREAEQGKIRAVLTDDQKPKYDAMVERMKERMKDRGPGGPDRGGPDRGGPAGGDAPPPPPPASSTPPSN